MALERTALIGGGQPARTVIGQHPPSKTIGIKEKQTKKYSVKYHRFIILTTNITISMGLQEKIDLLKVLEAKRVS